MCIDSRLPNFFVHEPPVADRSCLPRPVTSKSNSRRRHQHHRRPHPTIHTTSSAPPNRPIAPTDTVAMADETPKTAVAIPRTTRPMSEALLNEKVRLKLLWLAHGGYRALWYSPGFQVAIEDLRVTERTSCDHPRIPFIALRRPHASAVLKRNQLTLRLQWDRCLSSMLIRSGLGLGFGVVFSVLLFKRRAWPAFVGLGFGAGRSWEECDNVSIRSCLLDHVRAY